MYSAGQIQEAGTSEKRFLPTFSAHDSCVSAIIHLRTVFTCAVKLSTSGGFVQPALEGFTSCRPYCLSRLYDAAAFHLTSICSSHSMQSESSRLQVCLISAASWDARCLRIITATLLSRRRFQMLHVSRTQIHRLQLPQLETLRLKYHYFETVRPRLRTAKGGGKATPATLERFCCLCLPQDFGSKDV